MDSFVTINCFFEPETFGAYDNHLYGTIPEEMWTMSNLRDMWIMENNFSGTLPGSISGATSLGENTVYSTYIDCFSLI